MCQHLSIVFRPQPKYVLIVELNRCRQCHTLYYCGINFFSFICGYHSRRDHQYSDDKSVGSAFAIYIAVLQLFIIGTGMNAGGALGRTLNRLGMVSIIFIFPPQDLQTPTLTPILSKTICCHVFLDVSGGLDTFSDARIMAIDFLFDALERKP